MDHATTFDQSDASGIAIIGISGRFPGAKNVNEFWHNLRNGIESITAFSDKELEAAGVDPVLINAPNYVKAGGVVEGANEFDAAFFGYNPREAEIIDPQHRIFLECAWQALESAGYNSEIYEGLVGVYAGAGINTYLSTNLQSNRHLEESVGGMQIRMGNRIDNLATRVSYKLNLKGPSFTVQTNCSTSLVAVHLACQSLLNGECDMALAGGVRISGNQIAGYLYNEGGIDPPDAHTRTFDAKAKGVVGTNGVGVVMLKRLEDAIADGDTVYAIIKGSAINNDGSAKVGYTAPSVDGQAKVIAEALAVADVDPASITYIEAHGTGTALGDPIEMAALNQAFRSCTEKNHCAIGSVKTNIGHTDTAAGAAGLIKTVMALKHKMLPPSLNFEQPNPEIDFANSPFYVNTRLMPWKAGSTPRRAGISSFGLGGTNAHVVLEEAAPSRRSSEESTKPAHLLVLSAKTAPALEAMTSNLVNHLKQHPDVNLADVAYTLGVGRKNFNHRRMVVCRNAADAARALETHDPRRIFTATQETKNRSIVFMFSGQGAQYVNMALKLYESELKFRRIVDHCSQLLEPHLGLNLRQILFAGKEESALVAATHELKQTAVTQPALFVIEYALAKLWIEWGVRPEAMIGHSIGEYVAACLAGVFSLEDALTMVAARGRLMQALPGGAMLAVPLTEREVQPLLGANLSLAAINGPSMCVVSGSHEAVDQLEQQLTTYNVKCRRLHTSHAFHSQMMNSILEPFTEQVRKVALKAPEVPYISNVTGTWIKAAEAVDPNYWARHLRQGVRFADGLHELLKDPDRILIEVGPGQTLSTLVRQHPERSTKQAVFSSLPHVNDPHSDQEFLLNALGRVWLAGRHINWASFYADERRTRVPLPTYPFERQTYWIAPAKVASGTSNKRQESLVKNSDISKWFYAPVWKQSHQFADVRQTAVVATKSCWLIFADSYGLGARLAENLKQQNQAVFSVYVGEEFGKLKDREYTVNPKKPEDYEALLEEIRAQCMSLKRVAHLWSITTTSASESHVDQSEAEFELIEATRNKGFYSLLFLTRALAAQNVTDDLRIEVISNGLHEVTGEEKLSPEKAMISGPCKVIPQEYGNITCRSIDVVISEEAATGESRLVTQLMAELAAEPTELIVALRGKHRWIQTFEEVELKSLRRDDAVKSRGRLRDGGVYLITGGLGRIGLMLAEHLAKSVHAPKLILVGRSAFPEREKWEEWLHTNQEQHDVNRKIRLLLQLEKNGAEVLVVSADIASQDEMQEAVKRADEKFGAINGVFHAAGLTGEKAKQFIQGTPALEFDWQFQPKVYGLINLEKSLREREIDFYILFSSLATVLGGLGYSSYAAANSFMDAFAHKLNQTEEQARWLTVNWDGWRFDLGSTAAAAAPRLGIGASLVELAITPKEGAETLDRLLTVRGTSQIIVSTGDLQTRIDQWIKLEPARDTEKPEKAISQSSHPRPNLQNAYAAPNTDVERTVAGIWQDLLGIGQVGIYDDFFELGGHSLLGLQIISRLRNAFRLELPLRCLFESPSVASLAEVVAQHLAEKSEPAAAEAAAMARMLAELEELSDEEAQRLLVVELQSNNGQLTFEQTPGEPHN